MLSGWPRLDEISSRDSNWTRSCQGLISKLGRGEILFSPELNFFHFQLSLSLYESGVRSSSSRVSFGGRVQFHCYWHFHLLVKKPEEVKPISESEGKVGVVP